MPVFVLLPSGCRAVGHREETCERCRQYESSVAQALDQKEDPSGSGVGATDTDHGDGSRVSRPLRIGTLRVSTSGFVFPTKFVPPPALASATPSELFSGRTSDPMVTRQVEAQRTLPNDGRIGLIHTDGACLDNGQENPRASWAFWHAVGPVGNPLVVSGRLGKKGSVGDDGLQTSNRAELCAVIAALRFSFQDLADEGFTTLVIATDSTYVVEGSTNWARRWVENGWVRRAGGAVQNRDLWEALLGEIRRYKHGGVAVEFWWIPREWNKAADRAAKAAAAMEYRSTAWREALGINF